MPKPRSHPHLNLQSGKAATSSLRHAAATRTCKTYQDPSLPCPAPHWPSVGVTDGIDLQYQTPSLSLTTSGANRPSVQYAIRGQRTNEAQMLTGPPVGTYFTEVVMPRTFGFGSAFYDIQNIQVLKSVQGALFGRNMTGGAVLVGPNHPNLDKVQAEVIGQYGNYDLKDIYGMVNRPVVEDKLGMRLAGKFRNRRGFTTDFSTRRNYDDQYYYAFCASAELQLDRFTSYLVFDYLSEKEHGSGVKMDAVALSDPVNGSLTVIGSPNRCLCLLPGSCRCSDAKRSWFDLTLGKFYFREWGNDGSIVAGFPELWQSVSQAQLRP